MGLSFENRQTFQSKKNRTVCLNQWNARKYNKRQKLANRAQSSRDRRKKSLVGSQLWFVFEGSCWSCERRFTMENVGALVWFLVWVILSIYMFSCRECLRALKKNKIKKGEQTHRSIIGGRPFDQFHYSCTCFVVFHVPERKFDAIGISSALCYRLITRTKK